MANRSKYIALSKDLTNSLSYLQKSAQWAKQLLVVASFVSIVTMSSYIIQLTDGGKNSKPWENLNFGSLNLFLKQGNGVIVSDDKSIASVNYDNTGLFLNNKNQLVAQLFTPGLGLNLKDDHRTLNVGVDQTSFVINQQNQITANLPEPGLALALRNDSQTFDVQVDGSTVVINSLNQISIPPAPAFSIDDYSVVSDKFADGSITNSKISDQAISKINLAADVAGRGLSQSTDGALNVYVDNSTIQVDSNNALSLKPSGIKYSNLNSDVKSQVDGISSFSKSLNDLLLYDQKTDLLLAQLQQKANIINDTNNDNANHTNLLNLNAGNGTQISNQTVQLALDGTTLTTDANSNLKLANLNSYVQKDDSFGSILLNKPLSNRFGNASIGSEVFFANGSGPISNVLQIPALGNLRNRGHAKIILPTRINQQDVIRATFTTTQLPSSPNTGNGIFCSYVPEITGSSRFTNAAGTNGNWAAITCEPSITYSSQYIMSQITFILTMVTDTLIPFGSTINVQYALY